MPSSPEVGRKVSHYSNSSSSGQEQHDTVHPMHCIPQIASTVVDPEFPFLLCKNFHRGLFLLVRFLGSKATPCAHLAARIFPVRRDTQLVYPFSNSST